MLTWRLDEMEQRKLNSQGTGCGCHFRQISAMREQSVIIEREPLPRIFAHVFVDLFEGGFVLRRRWQINLGGGR